MAHVKFSIKIEENSVPPSINEVKLEHGCYLMDGNGAVSNLNILKIVRLTNISKLSLLEYN